MRILFDECTPRIVKTRLQRLTITTIQERGWQGIKNGELLNRAEREFDVLVTADRNLRRQSLSGRRILPSSCCRATRYPL